MKWVQNLSPAAGLFKAEIHRTGELPTRYSWLIAKDSEPLFLGDRWFENAIDCQRDLNDFLNYLGEMLDES